MEWSTVLTLYPHCETPGPVYVFPGIEEQNTSTVILQCCVSLPCFACAVWTGAGRTAIEVARNLPRHFRDGAQALRKD